MQNKVFKPFLKVKIFSAEMDEYLAKKGSLLFTKMWAKSKYEKDFCLILFWEKTFEINEQLFIFAQKVQDEYIESF